MAALVLCGDRALSDHEQQGLSGTRQRLIGEGDVPGLLRIHNSLGWKTALPDMRSF